MMNILLPTDFSENSRNAAVYAMQLFREVPCTFHLLHVLPVKGSSGSPGFLVIPPEIREKFRQSLDWLESIRINEKHNFTIAYKANYLIEAVREQVLEKKIDLILMGTKGVTNKDEAVIGKNTSDVMMKVKCPVLAISKKAVYREHRVILFPTDYKVAYNTRMLNTLRTLTTLSKASILILELFSSDKEPSAEQIANRAFLQNSIASHIPQFQALYPSKGKKPKALFNVNKNFDLVVMVAKNLNISQKLLKNHQNNQIPFINQLPLLILH